MCSFCIILLENIFYIEQMRWDGKDRIRATPLLAGLLPCDNPHYSIQNYFTAWFLSMVYVEERLINLQHGIYFALYWSVLQGYPQITDILSHYFAPPSYVSICPSSRLLPARICCCYNTAMLHTDNVCDFKVNRRRNAICGTFFLINIDGSIQINVDQLEVLEAFVAEAWQANLHCSLTIA